MWPHLSSNWTTIDQTDTNTLTHTRTGHAGQVISVERQAKVNKSCGPVRESPWTVYASHASPNLTVFYLFLSFFYHWRCHSRHTIQHTTSLYIYIYVTFSSVSVFWWLINSCRIRISLYLCLCLALLLIMLRKISTRTRPSTASSASSSCPFVVLFISAFFLKIFLILSTRLVRYSIALLVASVRLMKLYLVSRVVLHSGIS